MKERTGSVEFASDTADQSRRSTTQEFRRGGGVAGRVFPRRERRDSLLFSGQPFAYRQHVTQKLVTRAGPATTQQQHSQLDAIGSSLFGSAGAYILSAYCSSRASNSRDHSGEQSV